ncbi:MAG: 16S rRNA (cytidine(1402)-2'-O)-methyltransferase [Ilumatobacteraceae bacterium]
MTHEHPVTDAPAANAGGTLWLVATPIGNLGDLAPRAIDVLRNVALVCCEDTRRTGTLLRHAGIRVDRLAVANDHTEYHRIDDVIGVLGSGGDVAVVSDAGTPGISDPGERLVAAAIAAGYAVAAVPGPVAAITALTISGLSTERFVFDGFLPRKGRDRVARLAEVASERRTIVLYEAPHRIERTVADLIDACGADRSVVICRELTKRFEQVVRGRLGSVDLGTPRGEYVIVLAGRPVDDAPVGHDVILAELRADRAKGASTKDAVAAVADRLGVSKKSVYALAIADG